MKRRSDEEISAPLYAYDAAIRAEYGCFAGVDEAGRGCLAGPVVAGAVILPPNPGFYHHPQAVDELVDFVVARILDQLGVAHSLMPRWGEPAA